MLYFNFLYAPNGGGYQNSISYLTTLINNKFDFSDACLLVFRDSSIHKKCIENNIRTYAIKDTVISKIFLEILLLRILRKNDVVFAIFGPPLLFSENVTLNIGGMAISNVLYREIDFWGHLPILKRLLKKAKDRYRIFRYKKLDVWIFETDLLKAKAVSEFGFPEKRCFVVKMSPSVLVSREGIVETAASRRILATNFQHKFLFLCGAHPNKRLHALPHIAKRLKEAGLSFCFVLTAIQNTYLNKILDEVSAENLTENFINIGPVGAHEVAGVIDSCDYVCTFSVLESFSNNFVEAWAMQKPLFVTDADWSRSSCGQAAIYINFSETKSISSEIINSITNTKVLREVVESGTKKLNEHPTAFQKTEEYLSIIEKSINLGKISQEEFKKIKL